LAYLNPPLLLWNAAFLRRDNVDDLLKHGDRDMGTIGMAMELASEILSISMVEKMVALRHEDEQVVRAVVGWIVITMVDNLSRTERATKSILG